MNLRTAHLILIVTLLISPLASRAQPMGAGMGPPGGVGPPAFLEDLFPPNLVMRNQSALDLTDAQRDQITQAMEDSQKDLVKQQWQVERESEKLGKILASDHIDEGEALKQADATMTAEQTLKREHLALLIRIKNILTPKQQEILGKLRPQQRGRMH